MHNGPQEPQLTATARRLLGEDVIRTRFRVNQNDFATLLNALTRMHLSKDNCGLSFPFRSFAQAEPGEDDLANILVSG